jgi:Cd2+/Zn2+-exporting ATPase/Cu+-exporting ATPase
MPGWVTQRTARAIRLNIGFTAGYNAIGLAAAAQSVPDLGILANSARLLRARKAG